jgi:hypothetical protein
LISQIIAQAAKGEFGAAWLLMTAADFHSSFFNRRFLPSLCVAIVMGCRFILLPISKKGPFQILDYPKGGYSILFN